MLPEHLLGAWSKAQPRPVRSWSLAGDTDRPMRDPAGQAEARCADTEGRAHPEVPVCPRALRAPGGLGLTGPAQSRSHQMAAERQ